MHGFTARVKSYFATLVNYSRKIFMKSTTGHWNVPL